jgi:hypothetical protein
MKISDTNLWPSSADGGVRSTRGKPLIGERHLIRFHLESSFLYNRIRAFSIGIDLASGKLAGRDTKLDLRDAERQQGPGPWNGGVDRPFPKNRMLYGSPFSVQSGLKVFGLQVLMLPVSPMVKSKEELRG